MKNIDDLMLIAKRPCQYCRKIFKPEECTLKNGKTCACDFYMIALRLIREGKY